MSKLLVESFSAVGRWADLFLLLKLMKLFALLVLVVVSLVLLIPILVMLILLTFLSFQGPASLNSSREAPSSEVAFCLRCLTKQPFIEALRSLSMSKKSFWEFEGHSGSRKPKFFCFYGRGLVFPS